MLKSLSKIIFISTMIFFSIFISAAEEKTEFVLQSGHSHMINKVKFTPDGKYIFTSGKDGSIILWDFQSSKKLRIFKEDSVNSESFDYSEDMKYLAGVCSNFIEIWEVSTGKLIDKIIDKNYISSVVFYENNKILYSGGDNDIFSYDITRRSRKEFYKFNFFTGPVNLYMAKSRKFIFAATNIYQNDNYIYKISINTREYSDRIEIKKSGIKDIAVFSDEMTVVALLDEGKINLFNMGKKDFRKSIKLKNSYPLFVSLTDDDKKLFAASEDGVLSVYDPASLKKIKSIKILDDKFKINPSSISLSDNGNICALANSKDIQIINTETGKKITDIRSALGNIITFTLNKDKSKLYFSDNSLCALEFIDFKNFTFHSNPKCIFDDNFAPSPLELSKDEKFLTGYGIDCITTINLEKETVEKKNKINDGFLSYVTIGKNIVVTAAGPKDYLKIETNFTVRDKFSYKVIKTFTIKSNFDRSFLISADDKYIYTCARKEYKNYLARIDLSAGEIFYSDQPFELMTNQNMIFSHDGKYIFSAGYLIEGIGRTNYGVLTADPKTLKTLNLSYAENIPGDNFLFSPDDSRILVAGQNGVIDILSTLDLKAVKTFKGHTDAVTNFDFLDNDLFVSSSRDGSIKIWNISSGKFISFCSYDDVFAFFSDERIYTNNKDKISSRLCAVSGNKFVDMDKYFTDEIKSIIDELKK